MQYAADRRARIAHVGFFATGAAVGWAAAVGLLSPAPLWTLLAAFLVTCAAVGLAGRLPDGSWAGKIGRLLTRRAREFSGGFYGVVALAVFALSEIASLREDFAGASDLAEFSRQIGWEWFVGFSVDSIMNAVWAGLWPFVLMREHGMLAMVGFTAVAWLLFQLAGAPDVPDAEDELGTSAY